MRYLYGIDGIKSPWVELTTGEIYTFDRNATKEGTRITPYIFIKEYPREFFLSTRFIEIDEAVSNTFLFKLIMEKSF